MRLKKMYSLIYANIEGQTGVKYLNFHFNFFSVSSGFSKRGRGSPFLLNKTAIFQQKKIFGPQFNAVMGCFFISPQFRVVLAEAEEGVHYFSTKLLLSNKTAVFSSISGSHFKEEEIL